MELLSLCEFITDFTRNYSCTNPTTILRCLGKSKPGIVRGLKYTTYDWYQTNFVRNRMVNSKTRRSYIDCSSICSILPGTLWNNINLGSS
jgi:hypothetical protein